MVIYYVDLANHHELIDPKLKMSDAKKIISKLTGIKEANQMYQIKFFLIY